MCYGSILFSMSSGFKLVKWVRFFERNCIVKSVIFFTSFCWLWDFEKLKKTLMISTGTCGRMQTICMPEIIFSKKKKSKCEILNHLYFCPNFLFLGTALGRFSQWFFNFSFSVSHGGQHLHSPTIEKLPTTLSCDWILKEYAAKMIALVITPEKHDKFVN